MDTNMLIAQLVGVVAAICALFSFQCKETKKLVALQSIASVLWGVHQYLLGAYTGMLLNAGAIVRGICLCSRPRKWAESKYTVAGVTLLMAALGALSWTDWRSILPIVAMVAGTPFFWCRSGRTLRLAQVGFISPLWLVYNVLNYSIPGVITECLNMLSVLVYFWRTRRNAGDYMRESLLWRPKKALPRPPKKADWEEKGNKKSACFSSDRGGKAR